MINVKNINFRYEYKSKKLWALSLIGVLFLLTVALVSVFNGPHFFNSSFAIICIIATISQVHAWIAKKIPYLEIDGEQIQWGYTNGKTKKINFNDISEVCLNWGTDNDSILITEGSGNMERIDSMFFFGESNKLEEVLYQLQAKHGFIIENTE